MLGCGFRMAVLCGTSRIERKQRPSAIAATMPMEIFDGMMPNDPKLSDGRGWRGPCMAGGKAAVEAGAVRPGAVRCSAWLGDGIVAKSALKNVFQAIHLVYVRTDTRKAEAGSQIL